MQPANANSHVCPVHCSMLAEDAIKSAISDYYTKNPSRKPTDLSGTSMKMPTAEAVAA